MIVIVIYIWGCKHSWRKQENGEDSLNLAGTNGIQQLHFITEIKTELIDLKTSELQLFLLKRINIFSNIIVKIW